MAAARQSVARALAGGRLRRGFTVQVSPTVQTHCAPEARGTCAARGRRVAERDRAELQCQQQHDFEVDRVMFGRKKVPSSVAIRRFARSKQASVGG